jgi:hypothetical protein
VWPSQAIIEENLFLANEAPEGSALYSRTNGEISNNTFFGNVGDGGTITFWPPSHPLVANNIVAGTVGGYGLECIVEGASPWPEIVCNAFWDNEAGHWTGEGCQYFWYPGNFEADPLFCDPVEGDFQLLKDSPCLPGNHPDGYDCGLIGALGAGCGVTGTFDGDSPKTDSWIRVFPNPAANGTSISFALAGPALGSRLEILDIVGRRVRSLHIAERGVHTLHWNGRDRSGRDVASGVYRIVWIGQDGRVVGSDRVLIVR